MSTKPPTVFIVDDDPAVLDALKLMIAQEGIAVETFESAEAFLDAGILEYCGCIIIDVHLPGMNGLQFQKTLSERGIPLSVIFLTGHGDIPMSVRAMKAGAADFLIKPVTRKNLLDCVRSALHAGERLLEQASHNQQALSRLAGLTGREKQVMDLAIAGYSNKEIARHLGISHRTVEIHKGRVMHKTGTSNLLDLVRVAEEAGVIHSSN